MANSELNNKDLVSANTKPKKRLRWYKILGIVLAGLLTAVLCFALVYLNTWQQCTDENAMNDTALTHVSDNPDSIVLDGPGTESCFIFYPGARCDYAAYNAMLKQVSDAGMDVIVAKPPLHMQIFNVNQAQDYMSSYNYSHWYIGGHSMGGAIAGQFCANKPGAVEGLVLLSAWTGSNVGSAVAKCLSFIPENDTVLSMDKYINNRGNLPDDTEEIKIPGGNHANFGNYGDQLGDGEATITPEQQQSFTAQKIIKWLLS